MDHQNFLIIVVVALILSNLPKYKMLTVVALGLLAFDFATHFSFNNASNILHFSIDLIIVSILSAISQHINKDWVKILFIPIAIGILLMLHPYNKSSSSEKITFHSKCELHADLEILVQLKEHTNISKWIKSNEDKYEIIYPLFKPKDKSGLLDEYVGINMPINFNETETITQLQNDSRVAYVEFNEVLELKLPPLIGKEYSNQKAQGSDPKSNNQWAVEKMEMGEIHKLFNQSNSANSNTTLIAILDTGVEASHEDLKDNFLSINSGYDRDVRGHGTHCAGIAAAVTGNNIGIASLLPPQTSIKVTSIKVLSNFGIGAQHLIIAGIIEAADNGVDVISMSLGAPSIPDHENAYLEAVNYANKQGAIVVVSAGNSNEDAANYSPANTEGVITVAAVDKNLNKASFSNTIQNVSMGIAAPGQDIYSTFKGNQYNYQSGTSMSAPFVSGLIGLMRSIDGNLTTKEAFEILNKSAKKNRQMNVVDPLAAIQLMLK